MAEYEKYHLLTPQIHRLNGLPKITHASSNVLKESSQFLIPTAQKASSITIQPRVSGTRDSLNSEMIEGLIEIGDADNNSVCYIDYEKGKAVRHILNFSSPRTREAAERIGITFEDCARRYRSEFYVHGINQSIAKLRYEQHSKRVRDMKKAVFEMRKELIQRAERIELESKRNTKCEQKSKFFATTPAFDQSKIRIRPNERKAMKDFILKILLEKQLNENMKGRNASAQSAHLTERSLPDKTKSISIPPQTLHESFSQSSINDFLSRQVEKRIEGAQKLAEKLREEKQKEEEKQLLLEQESENVNSKLENFQRKQERAELIYESRKTKKIISAVQSTTAVIQILEKVQDDKQKKDEKKLASFLMKAEKIIHIKQKRAQQMAQLLYYSEPSSGSGIRQI